MVVLLIEAIRGKIREEFAVYRVLDGKRKGKTTLHNSLLPDFNIGTH